MCRACLRPTLGGRFRQSAIKLSCRFESVQSWYLSSNERSFMETEINEATKME